MGHTKLPYDTLDRHVLEAVKTLKSNIMFSSVDKPVQSLVMTSCEVGAGKTTTSTLLGITMAEAGKRTLLVETDLRRPNLGNTLGHRHEYGVSNVLVGNKTIEEVTCKTAYENLFFIDSGTIPPNPVELISSQQFQHFMEAVAKQYEIIIYDMAPVGLFIEPAIVAAKVDGVVLVIGVNQVDYRMAQEAKEQLERAHGKILGVVLNRVQGRGRKGYYYDKKYYGKYYDYYHRPGDASQTQAASPIKNQENKIKKRKTIQN